jgi:murein DD-endopeptidase MepM/ murein hydrolase activator NlpD
LDELRIVLSTKQELHYLVQENRAVLAGKVIVKVPSILDTTYAQFIHQYPHLKKLLDQLFIFKVGSLDDTDHLLAYTEKYEDEYGTLIKYDPPSYIALSKGDQLYQSYLFNDSYLDHEGQAFTQHHMIKPIDDTIPMRITGSYGWRYHPVTRKKEFHPAVDIAVSVGTPILSIDDGIITKMEHNYWLGTMLTVRHSNGLSSIYGHLSAYAPNLELGSQVSKGQILALSGNTGITTGAHLHFGLIYHDKPLSPLILWQPQTLAISNDEEKNRFEAVKQHIETELAHYKDTVNHDDQVLNNVQG